MKKLKNGGKIGYWMKMNTELYRVINTETKEVIAWFTDSEDLFHMLEWYSDSAVEYCVEKYELVDSW